MAIPAAEYEAAIQKAAEIGKAAYLLGVFLENKTCIQKNKTCIQKKQTCIIIIFCQVQFKFMYLLGVFLENKTSIPKKQTCIIIIFCQVQFIHLFFGMYLDEHVHVMSMACFYSNASASKICPHRIIGDDVPFHPAKNFQYLHWCIGTTSSSSFKIDFLVIASSTFKESRNISSDTNLSILRSTIRFSINLSTKKSCLFVLNQSTNDFVKGNVFERFSDVNHSFVGGALPNNK